MPCFHPIQAYRRRGGQKSNGSWPLVFNLLDGDINQPVTIPCGQCDGCKMEQARQWTVRCLNEAQMHKKNCFITLTYDDEHIPNCKPEMVNGKRKVQWKEDFVLFMKKLRKHHGTGIRFFHCGEYGSDFGRPHHHACIFNFDFDDKYHWQTRSGVHLYRSNDLEARWPYGFCTIGEVTPESASYVARYVVKKITGRQANFHYQGNAPEFTTMSRRPGIGKPWFDKYQNDVTAQDKVVVSRTLTLRPPRYYDKLYEQYNPQHMERIKKERLAKINPADNTPQRLSVKEKLHKLQLKQKARSYECPSSKYSVSATRKSPVTSVPLSKAAKSLLSAASPQS